VADRKITDLTALTTPASADVLPIVDVSEGAAADKNKKITVGELLRGAPDGTAAAPGFAFESDGGNGMFLGGTDILAFSTGGSQAVTIDASQRVGIGTTSPYSLLDLGSSLTGQKLSIYADATYRIGLGALPNEFRQYTHQGGFISWGHVSTSDQSTFTERARIDSSGRVGIGTTVPESDLHILKSAATPGIILERTTSATAKYKIAAVSGALTFEDLAAAQERARIDSSGRLGIGTSSPSNNLHITNTSASAGITLQSTAYTANYAIYAGATGTNKFGIYDNTASGYRMLIDSSGNVGIGTTTPQVPLDLIANASGYGIALRGRSADGLGQLRFTSNNYGTVYSELISTSSALAVNVNGSERARIDSDGRLLVGTPTAVSTQWAPNLQVVGADTPCSFVLARNDATVAINTTIAAIRVFGNDSNGAYEECARISVDSDGDHGTGDNMPTRLSVLDYCGWGEFTDGADED
jgi:hypothetical protein